MDLQVARMKNLVGGEFVESEQGEWERVIDPATGEVMAEVPRCAEGDVDRAGGGTNNGIVTTGATNRSDAEPSWSNHGSCVDLWAPGTRILLSKNGGGTAMKSGTSMASAHVAGGAALYLSSRTSASPTTVESVLKSDASSTGTGSGSGAAIERLDVSGY